MKRILTCLALSVLPVPAFSQAAAIHSVNVLDLQIAMRAALRSVEVCAEAGYQVGASVVDRFGLEQVTLRGNMGSAYVAESARRKAWTAAGFNRPTSQLGGTTGDGGAAEAVPGAMALGGGLPILTSSGELLGGIGVAGVGNGEVEAKCAKAGLDVIAEQLK